LQYLHSDIEPGIYAVIGAASFLAGTSRMTISLSVIMLEITNDLSFLPPIMLAGQFGLRCVASRRVLGCVI
jgi:H+/Cl- antiporter ClcA